MIKTLSKTLDRTELDGLPVADRLRLLEDVWSSLEQEADVLPSPDWHRDELDRRLAAHASDPSAATPWRDVMAELRAKTSK